MWTLALILSMPCRVGIVRLEGVDKGRKEAEGLLSSEKIMEDLAGW